MNESTKRIDYIVDSLINYKTKIEFLNKNGLFDAAKLYELFAIEICSLWFNQKFYNLNSQKANFPYVDLVSEDKTMYIQVSTAQAVLRKIKTTLQNIQNNNSKELISISKIVFFVLGDENTDKIGTINIGRLNFVESQHLITIQKVINKAKESLDFQEKLYDLLYQNIESYKINETKLIEEIETGKSLISKNIDDLINGEYEIDKSRLLNLIKKDKKHFISIQGDAGVGKTAFCKKLLKDEEVVLYARAERFTEVNCLEDIWGVDINTVLKYLHDKKIVLFIDALEFIADARKTKIELLQTLYEIAIKHNNADIVTTCRTSDKNAFIKIEANYDIKIYQLQELSEQEISMVAEQYSVIKKILNIDTYTQLLKSPFYLNLIISKINSVNDIKDINEFRNHIWYNLICLQSKSLPSNVKSQDIRNTVNTIVFVRAKEFLTGISKEKLSHDVLKVLLSEGVIIESEDNVRLKYDIYEDICFEKCIDNLFEECKGNFMQFFSKLENLGRCVYRRFQIWIENKLFTKMNQEKFLHKLLFSQSVSEVWKQQTMIGIVKSRFCNDFFEKYGEKIVEDNLIIDFIKTVNAFSFELSIFTLQNKNYYSLLKPTGIGRECLIKLVRRYQIYKQDCFKQNYNIIKLCTDYGNSRKFYDLDSETAVASCEILEYYVEKEIQRMTKDNIVPVHFIVNDYLDPVYLMADYTENWLIKFLRKLLDDYKCVNQTCKVIAKEIIDNILKKTTIFLAVKLPNELCDLAKVFWLYKPNTENRNGCFYNHRNYMSEEDNFGLNDNASHYDYEFKNYESNAFFNVLTKSNPNIALDWMIDITNIAAESYKKHQPNATIDVTIMFPETGKSRNYIGAANFWLAGRQAYAVPNLLGDGLYILSKNMCDFLDNNPYGLSQDVLWRIADNWKKRIYEKSNNIMMLTVIEEIGQHCQELLPGYAVELASSIEIVMMDLDRVGTKNNPYRNMLEKEIYMAAAIPEIEHRYSLISKDIYSLQEYMLYIQLGRNIDCKLKVEKVLDYLYSIIPNDKENALLYLQIQKMDARKAKLYYQKIEDRKEYLVKIEPEITGEAEKFRESNQNNDFNTISEELFKIGKEMEEKFNENTLNIEESLVYVEKLKKIVDYSNYSYLAQMQLIAIISYLLTKAELRKDKRSNLCKIWISAINDILNYKSYMFVMETTAVLFKQIEYDLDKEVAVSLKRLMLDCLLYQSDNGKVLTIRKQLKKYLTTNKRIALTLFYTIVALAQDEMNHHLFNAEYMTLIEPASIYVPNRQIPYYNVDRAVQMKKETGFQSKKEKIIEAYLVNEEKLDITDFDINHYDIGVLSFVSGCGLKLHDVDFCHVMKVLVSEAIEILNSCKDAYRFFSYRPRFEITTFLENEIVFSDVIEDIADILFNNNIKFSKFRSGAFEFYNSIIGGFLPTFFDAYQDRPLRNHCINNIKVIENKLNLIQEAHVRKELSKIMFLTADSLIVDGNKLVTHYSFSDKLFLNKIWSKYGMHHPKEMLDVIYRMKVRELLPEVLIPINNCFKVIRQESDLFESVIKEREGFINVIITEAFLNYNDQIKRDEELTEAYENILQMLVNAKMEEAAVLLDGFRVH